MSSSRAAWQSSPALLYLQPSEQTAAFAGMVVERLPLDLASARMGLSAAGKVGALRACESPSESPDCEPGRFAFEVGFG
jgi:hypothetical protein